MMGALNRTGRDVRTSIRVAATAVAAAVLVGGLAPPAGATSPSRSAPNQRAAQGPAWVAAIDRLVRGHPIGVSVREEGQVLYRHRDARRRVPASNQKLLLSMAILDRLGPEIRIVTQAAATTVVEGIVQGDLWILGFGDPAVDQRRIEDLASAIQGAGVVRVAGSVVGSTGYFKRDWRAPGWKPDFPREQVPLPSALTFEGNVAAGEHIGDPELRAAKELTRSLRDLGVSVAGEPGAAEAPAGLVPVAQVESGALIELLEFTNRYSSNFYAEVLGKRLGAEAAGAPGTIAKGAAAMRAWTAEGGVGIRARDASGLSYANRLSPAGLVRLLGIAEDELWGEAFRESLPEPGQGTLRGRLRHLRVHAKTGTLTGISALSGWVYLRRRDVWAEFSILSRGMSKDAAVRIEDRVVRILARSAG
jgi:D-alanyl-D-alanine carboxypeptidase/D-alanyl-D-alanine-endopeptidase (penicillin-binding protein 4)